MNQFHQNERKLAFVNESLHGNECAFALRATLKTPKHFGAWGFFLLAGRLWELPPIVHSGQTSQSAKALRADQTRLLRRRFMTRVRRSEPISYVTSVWRKAPPIAVAR